MNGYEVKDDLDALLVFANLWLQEGETRYTLELERDASTIELDYSLTDSGRK